MPSASDEDQEWARNTFGSIDDLPISNWLEEQGYRLTSDWLWVKPQREPTEKELKALQFLIDEWDYGGFVQFMTKDKSDV